MANVKKGEKGEAPTGVRDVSVDALNNLVQGGDSQLIFELLIANARQLAATGKGQQLIKMAPYMGDESVSGLAIRRGFIMLGHIVDLDYKTAEALANELYLEERNNPVFDFLEKITHYVFAICRLARGDLTGSLDAINISLESPLITSDLGDSDKINLIRIRCAVFMAQSAESKIEAEYEKAKKIADGSAENAYGVHLMAIKSMVLSEQGEYIKAYETAKSALYASEANGYTGITGALDAKFVMARSLLAFSKLDQANELFEEIKVEALKIGLLPWYVLAESSIIRNYASAAKIQIALERCQELAKFTNRLDTKFDLGWMVDMAEMDVRFKMKDQNRVNEIAKRIPEMFFVKQVVDAMVYTDGKHPSMEAVLKLPEKTARQRIYKYLCLSEYPASPSNNPKNHLRQALQIAQETGYREIFVKQSGSILNLLISLSSEEPSLFLEELTRDCLKRVELESAAFDSKNESLTSRELQVLKQLSTGKAIVQIGKELHISQNTMKTHLRNIYRKLQVDGRKSAVEKAKSNFII